MKKRKYLDSYLFGYRSSYDSSGLSLMRVPWEVTTSYGGGASLGPQAIYEASPQIDLFDIETGEAYKVGYHLKPLDPYFAKANKQLMPLAKKIIKANDLAAAKNPDGVAPNPAKNNILLRTILNKVNIGCERMVELVYQETKMALDAGKIPGLIGGDHSTPLGAIKAISEKYVGQFGVLHIDAHADLRDSYQGFLHSHASIMRNVCELKTSPIKVVQVGIRDFCLEEYDYIKSRPQIINTHFDRNMRYRAHEGESWVSICKSIIETLPQKVYVSFDIDGLSPEYCPHTGTPVPGGLSYDEAVTLLSVLGKSGRQIIGFDLNEVVPGRDDEWDGNVGARILYKLCGWSAVTNKLT